VIEANGGSVSGVTITSPNVVFGAPKKGFTLKGADQNGLYVSGFPTGVTVSSNLGVSNGFYGFVLTGTSRRRAETSTATDCAGSATMPA
jgi:hypothetical protein